MKENVISHKRISLAIAETLGFLFACQSQHESRVTTIKNDDGCFVCFDSNFLKEFGYTNPTAFVKDYFGFDAPDIEIGVFVRFINSEDYRHGFLVHPCK